jgi:hypothetical protein
LPRYTFGDFRAVVCALRVMALAHYFARVAAARQRCVAGGSSSSVLILDTADLSSRLRECTGLSEGIVGAIVRDLTYGERGIRNPDPALQPLIPLTGSDLAVPPTLLIGSDLERNFTVLLNRLPEERDAYSRLSTEREDRSRQGILQHLQAMPIRFWHGQIPGRDDLPDIDLALIDDIERTCLILELKAFVAPAEPREVLEKTEEIERGIAQIRRLRDAFDVAPATLRGPLAIHDSYSVQFAIASETFVGTADVQDQSVPVVRTGHLVRRILLNRSLSTTCGWLHAREYLPTECVHYAVKDIISQVGNWKVCWYGIKPLIQDNYI